MIKTVHPLVLSGEKLLQSPPSPMVAGSQEADAVSVELDGGNITVSNNGELGLSAGWDDGILTFGLYDPDGLGVGGASTIFYSDDFSVSAVYVANFF